MNKNELRSRREFFKRAAKGALPILGAIFLANTPVDSIASEAEPTGCSENSCSRMCMDTCRMLCRNVCREGCKNACVFMCGNTCGGACNNTCVNIANNLQK